MQASFALGTNLKAWLLRIMHNRAMDGFRDRKREVEGLAEYQRSAAPPSGHDDSDTDLPLDLDDEVVRRAIESLSPRLRLVFTGRYVDRLSYERLSERTGLPVGTVSTRLLRARQALRRFLRTQANADTACGDL